MTVEDKNALLVERIESNYADYRAKLMTRDRQELIDGAAQIAATTAAYEYLSLHDDHAEPVLDHLLKFQDPLEIVASRWPDFSQTVADMGDIFDGIYIDANDIKVFPLISDQKPEKPPAQRRYMDVDVEASLKAVMEQTTSSYQTDFEYDRKAFRRAAISNDPEQKRLLWLARPLGTQCVSESQAFILGSRDYQSFASWSGNNRAYAVEITGMQGRTVKGNLYELDYPSFAGHLFHAAIRSTESYITIDYADGRSVDVSRNEYDRDRHRLMSESGPVQHLTFHAQDESQLNALLDREHRAYAALPKGNFKAHLRKLSDEKVAQEAVRVTTALQNANERGEHDAFFSVRLSQHFMILASSDEQSRLFDALPFQRKCLTNIKGQKGIFALVRKDEILVREAERRPSVKAQLQATRVSVSDSPAKDAKEKSPER